MGTSRREDETIHILIVDDDDGIRGIVGEYLSSEGYRVSTASHGDAMWAILAQSTVDLVLLDLLLPGDDGLALARMLREQSNVGIIIMSGRGETVDRIIGLEMGSDDYLVKPFEIRELLARIRSVLRRTRMTAEEQGPPIRPRVRFAGWTFDLSSREMLSPFGDPVHLTTGEFNLLAAFVASPNKVLSRDRLLELACGRRAGPANRTIDVQVGRLRRKLRGDNTWPHLIKAVRGAGYIFNTPVETVDRE